MGHYPAHTTIDIKTHIYTIIVVIRLNLMRWKSEPPHNNQCFPSTVRLEFQNKMLQKEITDTIINPSDRRTLRQLCTQGRDTQFLPLQMITL